MCSHKYESNETFSQIFEIIDNKINDIVKEMDYKDNFKELTKMYFDWLNFWRKKAGTSQGFTGLSEYIVLKAISLFLEQKQGIEFELKPKMGEKEYTTYFFISKDKRVIITHAISIDENMKSTVSNEKGKEIEFDWVEEKLRPDIVIFKEDNGCYRPEAVIEIKIYKVSPNAIRDEVEKFEKTSSEIKSKPLRCIIFFTKQSDENKQGIDYFITPENQKFREMLQNICARI